MTNHKNKTNFSALLYAVLLFSFSACSVNKAKLDNNLKRYFDSSKVEGCFTMINNSDGQVTVYNMNLDTSRFSPASTFQIVNSLIALETGIVSDENMLIKWDGIVREDSSCNKDMNITQAFQSNCVSFYQEVARRMGKDTLQRWVDSLSYGNKNITGSVDSFWLNNNLTISPDEQLGLLKRLYFDQLPFRKSVQQSVRDMMIKEDNTAYKLSYQTGLAHDKLHHSIGWLIGWIEENRHVYFFVTMIQSSDPAIDMEKKRIDITKGILKQYGFFEGKK